MRECGLQVVAGRLQLAGAVLRHSEQRPDLPEIGLVLHGRAQLWDRAGIIAVKIEQHSQVAAALRCCRGSSTTTCFSSAIARSVFCSAT